MKRLMYFAVIVLAGALTLASAKPVSAARTPLTICNQTSVALVVAIGYHSSGVNDTAGSNILTGPYVSRGWFTVAPGQCQNMANPFNARYMFWWGAQSHGFNITSKWTTNGNDNFCIPNLYGPDHVDNFTFEDENASEAACEKGHFSTIGPNVWVSESWLRFFGHQIGSDKWISAS